MEIKSTFIKLCERYWFVFFLLSVLFFYMWLAHYLQIGPQLYNIVNPTCSPFVYITPETLSSGIKYVFIMNERVNLTVSLRENFGCENTTKINILTMENKTYNFSDTITIPLDTTLQNDDKYTNLEIYFKRGQDGSNFKQTIMIISPTSLEKLQNDRLGIPFLILGGISSICVVLGFAKQIWPKRNSKTSKNKTKK